MDTNTKEVKMTLEEKMIKWRAAMAEIQSLEEEIKAEVIALGKTFDVGNIRASYTAGRRTFDYETPCASLPQEVLDAYTVTVPPVEERKYVDYTALCKGEGIEPVVKSQTSPSVTLKLGK